jgi:preprotein translocase subunit SecF
MLFILTYIFGKDHKITQHATLVTVSLILMVIFAVGVGIKSCWSGYKEEKTQEHIDTGTVEIQKDAVNANVAETQVEQSQKEVKNANEKRQKAQKEVDDARKSDSSNANSNVGDVLKRFCSVYPQDSRCK